MTELQKFKQKAAKKFMIPSMVKYFRLKNTFMAAEFPYGDIILVHFTRTELLNLTKTQFEKEMSRRYKKKMKSKK